jgi:hypothetical protein
LDRFLKLSTKNVKNISQNFENGGKIFNFTLDFMTKRFYPHAFFVVKAHTQQFLTTNY